MRQKSYSRNAWIKVFLISVIFSFLLGMDCVYAEPEDSDKKIVIVWDVSGSMGVNDEDRAAVQWVKNFCTIGKDTGISMSVLKFHNNVNRIFENELVTDLNYSRLIGDVEQVSYAGNRTDHLKALKTAEKLLSQGNLEHNIIVMLSDGDLDYEGRPLNAKIIHTPQEEEAIEAFEEECRSLSEQGCKIYLVGFGLGQEVEMFKNLAEEREDDAVFYLSKEMSSTEKITEIFKDAGHTIQFNWQDVMENGIVIALQKKYDRVIIEIKKGEESCEASKEDFQVFYEFQPYENEWMMIDTETTLYLEFRGVTEGTYEVHFNPSGYDEKVGIITQEGELKAPVEVSEENGAVSPAEPPADIQIEIELEGADEDPGMPDYYIAGNNAEQISLLVSTNVENGQIKSVTCSESGKGQKQLKLLNDGNWKATLDNPGRGVYDYQVTVLLQEGGMEEKAFRLSFPQNISEETETVKSDVSAEEITVAVYEEVDLLTAAMKENGYSADDLSFNVITEVDGEDLYSCSNDFKISFKQEGEYAVELFNRGVLNRSLKISVTGQTAVGWIWANWKILAVALGVIMCSLGIIFALIRRRER